MPMRFETRSKETVLDDLTKRVGELPLNHPDRPALVRMIDGMRAEIALPGNGDADVSRKEGKLSTSSRMMPRWLWSSTQVNAGRAAKAATCGTRGRLPT
jgi:hypothetical protein